MRGAGGPVHVYYHGTTGRQLVGRLLFRDRRVFFEYDPAFVKTGIELSPFRLPLRSGVIAATDRTFDGLFGVFNDSLPDGWGKLLLDRRLGSMGINPGTLSPLDRLCLVGEHGMGALSYEPAMSTPPAILHPDLDEIDHEIRLTLEEDDRYVDDLIALGGSSAGARPKILLPMGEDEWIIKFRSSLDPRDIGAIEYAFHLMAVEAGLDVPEARLFPSRGGAPGFFGVKRFDRKNNRRIHMHTVSGLLHADHREPCLDYETIMKATLHLTRDARQCEVQFRNAVFNVLGHNRDDHSKNFSFLMEEGEGWRVSPAYDLTFSSGPAGEHSTMIMGEGKNPGRDHLLKLAGISGIHKDRALEIINEVLGAVQKWKLLAADAGVSKTQVLRIGEILDGIGRNIRNS